ncbi:MBL fold metallo-hydrolase [Psychrobacter sp.]|uniref:MBL fold metallo-hydrolase n=1 Tax=Psychrobacter sp. TaxID=56811 RepID=UPI0025D79AC7|nr:MBL fold metallo-hydrolase [Psychrobacter sp.]
MQIKSFLHHDTETYTHVLIDERHQQCAIFDPVLDYDFKSGHTSTESVDVIIEYVKQQGLEVKYIIETHAHADHLSSAQHIKRELGGELMIGKHITEVQKIFKAVFNLGNYFKTDASQFDKLTEEGTEFMVGDIKLSAIHVPGHTPADMAYIAKDTTDGKRNLAVFIGDTLFAPDVGTARVDFPGGDVNDLYHSTQKILSLPNNTEIYLCHDYPPEGREHCPVTTVAAEKSGNIHVREGISQSEFAKMRTERDAKLKMPRLIIPSVQVNIRAGSFPEPESNGVQYLKVPINTLV